MRASSSGISMPAARSCAAKARRAAATVSCAAAAQTTVADFISDLFGREQRRLIFRHQRIDELVERLTFENLRQLVEGEIDAVVRHPPLRVIVGADAFRAVAGADLAAPLGGARGFLFLPLRVVEPG